MTDLSFYQNKKVLITGHTGFKGSWLTKILLDAGADVAGYALEPPTDPNLFTIAGLDKRLGDRSVIGDIRDFQKLFKLFQDFQPEIVLHLAAQPIVTRSYEDPQGTYETNVMGTVNLLECVRKTPSVKSVLNVTTDKVYENFEWQRAYKEEDRLDGYDPYSNSKSCSELVTHSYKRSFLDEAGIAVSTARAGNVIGGGDFAYARILPDCVRAAEKGESVILRNPDSTRPYQHVLEPLFVYLMIAEAQYKEFRYAGYYNVGPDDRDCLTTGHIADLFCQYWGNGMQWENHSDGGPHEANFLKLDNTKIKETFGWKPVWDVEEAVKCCVEFAKAEDKVKCMEEEIRAFLEGLNADV